MESPDYSPPHVDASRPSLGFPLGTALLLIIIFSLSGIFSCCYHWDKLRSLRRAYAADLENPTASAAHLPDSPSKLKPSSKDSKANQRQSVPVLMPGDNIPKFIALPCPCEPPRQDNISGGGGGGGAGDGGGDLPKPPIKPPRSAVPLY